MSELPFPEMPHAEAGRKRIARLPAALVSVLILGFAVYASRDTAGLATGGDKTTTIAVAKANAFLDMLDAKQRDKVLYEFGSAKKPSWSNLPVTMVPRNGLPLGELTKPQRAAALDVLAAVLSKQGYQKAIDIMNADDQLVKGKDNKMRFGTEHFFIALFGKPSPTEPWMVQFGGHHLGINVTMVGKNAVLTPTLTGTQPDAFTRAGKTVRPLGPENDLAFKLVNMLDAQQRKQAVLGAKPKNLVLGPGKDGKAIPPEGLKGSALNEAQRAVLVELIAAWVNILPPDAAAAAWPRSRRSSTTPTSPGTGQPPTAAPRTSASRARRCSSNTLRRGARTTFTPSFAIRATITARS
ncbi:MAG: DUF3500 domain-containing protein [Gemmataceae bacterium]|nr:DUF3500 domain-containing protein [Gemmataceae bacterium]